MSEQCTICRYSFELIHWHHTIPQSLGGKDSLQIPLCAQCHNMLHAHGDAIVAARRNGTTIKRKFWKNCQDETNAAPYLEILVSALERGRDVLGKQYVMSIKASPALHKALHLFKQDSNAGSLENAMIILLSEQLRNKGYLDNEHREENKYPKQNPAGRSLKEMWGL